jgi:glycosyltransferase involved in cell wall biosynthesis
MRVIITSFTFPPEASGVSHVAYSQARGLASRGHEVTVATAFLRERDPKSFPGLKICQFDVRGCASLKFGHHGETQRYQEFIATEPADIILCHSWQNWATDVAVPAFPRSRAKKVILSHGFDAHIWSPNPRVPFGLGQWLCWQPYVLRFPALMRKFDHLIFLAERKDCGRFFDHWLAASLKTPLSIIPNGIHLEALENTDLDFRKAYGIDPGHFLLLNVANYCDRKDQIATLRAFLRARRKDATLVFIGSEFKNSEYGAGLEQIYQQAKDPAGRVLFLEKIPRPMINAAYKAADLFVLTAKAETQPLAILDAMGAGLPFISTDAGCASELPGGIIVRGEAETANAINKLLDDSDLARRLGAEGRAAAVARYSWKSVVDAYEKLFARLLVS